MSEITYSRVGDYNLPDLCLPEQEPRFIGKYGLLHKTYLKTHRKILYTNLLTAGTLYKHLVEIDAQANERLELVTTHLDLGQTARWNTRLKEHTTYYNYHTYIM